jgi:histidinol phosphatase-like enzyme (inositol monophosphatase family)
LDAAVGVVDLADADALVRGLLPEAGEIALRHFRTELVPEDKGGTQGYDPVTVADRAIETLVRDAIHARFPDHRVIGEEHGTSGPADAAAEWVIDPIDGTKAFVTGVPAWGLLVGLVVDGVAVAGWLHQPYLDETYAAIAGVGTFEHAGDRRPLGTRATTGLADARMYTTHPSMFRTADEQAAFERIAAAAQLQRFGGDCCSYGLLALGCVDLVVESSLQPYDIVALIPIVEAAGGVITNRSGASPLAGGFVIAAATPELHAEALTLANQETVR